MTAIETMLLIKGQGYLQLLQANMTLPPSVMASIRCWNKQTFYFPDNKQLGVLRNEMAAAIDKR